MAKYDCLIVDDEEALSKSTCEYLNMFGVSTYWAADEQECFDFLRDCEFMCFLALRSTGWVPPD